MNWKTLAMGSILALFVAGCGKETPPAPSTTTKPTAPVTPAVPAPAVPPAPTVGTAPAVPAAPSVTAPAVPIPTLPAAPATAPLATRAAAATAPVATMAASATAAAATQATTLKETADKLLAEATQAIKDKKWDIADAAMTQLDKIKPSLPADYGPRIDQLKTAFNAAKALSQPGTSLPNFGF